MTEKQLADSLFLLFTKVLKLNIKAEYSIPINEEKTKHRRLDFVGFFKNRIDVIELKIEPITTAIVIDALINKDYLTLARTEFKADVSNVEENLHFYFISSRGITEEAASLLSLITNVSYIDLTVYTKQAVTYALENSRGLTPINVLGSIIRDYTHLMDAVFVKELQNNFSVYDYYRS